jgi:hypothetical protein
MGRQYENGSYKKGWNLVSFTVNHMAHILLSAELPKPHQRPMPIGPVINYALPALGVCRKFSRDLVFSPT